MFFQMTAGTLERESAAAAFQDHQEQAPHTPGMD